MDSTPVGSLVLLAVLCLLATPAQSSSFSLRGMVRYYKVQLDRWLRIINENIASPPVTRNVVKYYFPPNAGIERRQRFQEKFGHHGSNLVAAIGQGEAAFKSITTPWLHSKYENSWPSKYPHASFSKTEPWVQSRPVKQLVKIIRRKPLIQAASQWMPVFSPPDPAEFVEVPDNTVHTVSRPVHTAAVHQASQGVNDFHHNVPTIPVISPAQSFTPGPLQPVNNVHRTSPQGDLAFTSQPSSSGPVTGHVSPRDNFQTAPVFTSHVSRSNLVAQDVNALQVPRDL